MINNNVQLCTVHPENTTHNTTENGQRMIGEDISRRHAGIALCVLHEPQRRGRDKEEYYAYCVYYTYQRISLTEEKG